MDMKSIVREKMKEAGAFDGRYRVRKVRNKKCYTRKRKHTKGGQDD